MSDDLYSSFENRMDSLLGKRIQYFSLIRAIGLYYATQDTDLDFDAWVLENYGLAVTRDKENRIQAEHTIVDEKKYMMAILKYGI